MADLRSPEGRETGVPSPDEVARLISLASHQLRSPLSALRGAVDLLCDDESGANPEQLELLAMIKRNCLRLESAVGDVSQFARVMHGCVKPTPAEIDVREIAERVLGEFEARADARHIVVEKSITGMTSVFFGAADILSAILVNLVSNAIKFAPRGSTVSVHISIALEMVRMRVADGGAALPEADRRQLFTPFFHRSRGDDPLSAGIGLGLFLAQHLARLHGGDVVYDGEAAVGNTFLGHIRSLR